MKTVAKFEKVSFEQFCKDVEGSVYSSYFDVDHPDDLKRLREIYDNIKLPKRATVGSAGYDFFLPFEVILKDHCSILIPTGIRCRVREGWVLSIYPRSGLGFKHRVQLDNTVSIIDSDYYDSSNEGHIMLKVGCDSFKEKEFLVKEGQGIAQGIFLEYGLTVDDDSTGIRDGGFGSTSKSEDHCEGGVSWDKNNPCSPAD